VGSFSVSASAPGTSLRARCGEEFLVARSNPGSVSALSVRKLNEASKPRDQGDHPDRGERDGQHRDHSAAVALVAGGVDLRLDGVLVGGDLVIDSVTLASAGHGEVVSACSVSLTMVPTPVHQKVRARRSSGSW